MRLVDLHCDWLRQYATETTLYDGSLYPEGPRRVGRLDGYLLGASLAVLSCARKPEDWSQQPDPWNSLGLMIARYESEFAGRILRHPADVARWQSLPADGLCWGVIGVAGFDFLVRRTDDLDRLPAFFERGVRVFQPVASAGGVLGGSARPGDDRGLSDLGRAFLSRIAGLARVTGTGPRPILDLAGLDPLTMAETLRWYDEDPANRENLPIALSRATFDDPALQDDASPSTRIVRELRSRGCVIGLTPGAPGIETTDDLKRLIDAIAAIPFEGRPGHAGIAIAADLTGVERTAPGLGSARDIVRWLVQAFGRQTATMIAADNARALLLRSAAGS